MHAFSILLTLGALLSTSFAAPAPTDGTLETTIVPFGETLDARDKTAIVTTYNGDTCNGGNSGFSLVGGGSRCVNVANTRSISASGRQVTSHFLLWWWRLTLYSGCNVVVWAGADCRGDSAVIKYGSCVSVLFASVLVGC